MLAGHEDSVWGLTYSTAHHRLASCSADGTVRIWDPQNSSPCLSVFNKERGKSLVVSLRAVFCVQASQYTISCPLPEHGTPTSVAFVATDPNQVVVSFDGGETLLYDLNTEQSTTALETQTKDGMSSVENTF